MIFSTAVAMLPELFVLRHEDSQRNKVKARLEQIYSGKVSMLCRLIATHRQDSLLRTWFQTDCCVNLLENDAAQTLRLTLLNGWNS